MWIHGGIDFAYTVGLWHTFRRPELVMFGLTGKDMQLWLNNCVDLAGETGWPREDELFEGLIEGFPTQLKRVHYSWHQALFGTADRFYGDFTVPVLQIVWPDRNGLWPWDPDATKSCRTRQAQAWLPVAEHPPGAWRLVGELEPGFEFDTGPDAWALTSRAVLAGDRRPAKVVLADDAFDVLDERGYDADDLCLAYLGELVTTHRDLVACADLPDEHVAVRDGREWSWARLSEKDRRASVSAWKRLETP